MYAECTINEKTHFEYRDIVTGLASFVGNILLIVVVYRSRTIRPSTDYFVVSMAASDILLPSLSFFDTIFVDRKDAGYLSQTTGAILCKFFVFFFYVSYGVSILSLVIITVYRFHAVVFPMHARVQSRRTCILLLFLTWVLAIAMSSPWLFFFNFNLKHQNCTLELSRHHLRIWHTIRISLFFFVPLFVMLVLYPMIVVNLRRQKIPGNANYSQAAVTRRKQNFRLTALFITITVAFMLCWGINQVIYIISLFSPATNCTIFYKVNNIVSVFPNGVPCH